MGAGRTEYWPRLTRFYGLGPEELQNLPHNIITLYVEAMPELIAEEHLRDINSAQLHRWEDDAARTQYMRSLREDAGIPEAPVEKLNVHDHAAQLAGLGIKAVIEDA